MPPHLSLEMRNNIFYWRYELSKKGHETEALARCSEATVWEMLRLHREYGAVVSPNGLPRGRARTRKQLGWWVRVGQ
ncbi:hypothetical protein FIBSPDRAFT_869874 [Athelia psychrophila]|uniref:Uncharacterized protein n=1 Tax=Athelia psychrophila TaxID=1759441 RepID=A0A166BR05_9AGAM|nr:hypothetical protein FIBSPDRAFT_869874 [Fibularhizoctonia sp. CBS 109695]